MGMNQVTEEYATTFITAHTGHNLTVSVVTSMDMAYEATIEDGLVYPGERVSEEIIEETGGHYLYCIDCKIEQEINSSDVVDED